jgi:S-adenosylmethionine synthetase
MARYIAKNLVASGICDEIIVQLSYCISQSYPVSIMVDTKNSSKYNNKQIIDAIENIFDLNVSGIIEELELLKPIYKKVTNYGHFGRDENLFKWEKIDKIDKIKEYFINF